MHNPTTLQKIRSTLRFEDSPNQKLPHFPLPVYRVEGFERLGFCSEYEITVVSATPLVIEELSDRDVTLAFEDEKASQNRKEICLKIYEAKERSPVGDKHLYTLKAVHPLYYLKLNRRYEIYQDKSAYEIIDTILKRYKALLDIVFHTDIAPHLFIKREYSVQYAQSDLEFIQMLCEQEGVTLWIKDDARPFDIRLSHINGNQEEPGSQLICGFETSKSFRPTLTKEDYYDFKRPSFSYMTQGGERPAASTMPDNPRTSRLRRDIELMYHHDRLEAPRDKDIRRRVDTDILKAYSRSETIEGVTKDITIKTGLSATLFDSKSLKKAEAVITEVKIKALFPNALSEYTQSPKSIESMQFEAKFKAAPKKSHFIPAYNIQKPKIPSILTATVSSGSKDTGASPNTVDIDEYGRIRVIFHFDPKYPTSCYIRFAEFFAGDGWGSRFIPRVNTEVIVSFINGDPDRPVVTGSLYNGNNKIPKSLPSNKTQSYIKTRSMPGTPEEYNMLLFEDRQNEELVHIRAQKDYRLHALNNNYTDIDNDRIEKIGNDESVTVGRERKKSVGKDENITIGKNRSKSVGEDENITVGNDRSTTVGRDESLHIKRGYALKIDRDYITYTGNSRKEEIYADYTVKTGGHHTHTVGGRMDVKAGEHIKEITKLKEMHGSERIIFKSAGGSIIIDGGGITLKGNVTIKGNVAISPGGGGGAKSWSAAANRGVPICASCLLKEIMEASNGI